MKECTNCGALIGDTDAVCKYCSQSIAFSSDSNTGVTQPEEPIQPDWSVPEPPSVDNVQPEEPIQPNWTAPQPPEAPQPPPYDPPPSRQEDPYRSGYQQYAPPPPPYSQPGQQQYNQQQPYGQPGQQQYNQQQPYGQPGQQQYNQQPYGQPGQQYNQQQPYGPQININNTYGPAPNYRNITRVTAGILAILLGGIGVHKFYMGRIGLGIVYIVFCWTMIPAIIGLIEGIIYLCYDDYTFREKYCRLY